MKKRKKCARCGGERDYEKCGEGVEPRCCSCGGKHSVAYWGCEVLRKEARVQQVKKTGNLSYAEAGEWIRGECKKGGNCEQVEETER